MEALDHPIQTMVLPVLGRKGRRSAVDKALSNTIKMRKRICLLIVLLFRITVDGFLGLLEAQGWLSLLGYLESKVDVTLIAEFYHTMDRSSLSCVLVLVDGRPFQVFAIDIFKFLGAPNEGDVAYFENMASDSLQNYIHVGKLNEKVLKSKVIYKNLVNAKDLTLAFSF